MNVKLTVQERLKDLRTNKHLTLEELAAETNLSRSALGGYESDAGKDMSPYAVMKLADFFEVSTDYLLGVTDTKNHPNTELHALHLSDGVIDLLTSGQINNRLLCELLLHPDFQRLLIDTEIYIDRIADMRIRDLNVLLDVTREMVQEQYAPKENDVDLRTMELAHIHADEYFRHTIHEDMDGILADLREAHAKDSTTAPEESGAEQAKRILEDAASVVGSDQEKKVMILLKQLGFEPDALTQEELVNLVNTFRKSKLLNSGTSQRGKRQGPAKSRSKKKRK